MTERLLARLSEKGDEYRFLVIVGPSGSGKSSLVRAGLLPALRKGALVNSTKPFIIEMLPGTHPLEELEAALLRVAVTPMPELLDQLREDRRGLVRIAKRLLPNDSDTELIVLVDQFEEVFTLVSDEDMRVRFIDNLLSAATDPRSRVRVILTLRADFYDRPLLYPRLAELVRGSTEVIVPLTAREMEQAITAPAERVELRLEAGLVSTILNDLGEQPGTLPLLQYALTDLYQRREGLILTLAAYQTMGGVLGALARRADETYATLEPKSRELARQMFLRLVTLGEGTEDTRRRVPLAELYALGDETAMEEVITAFADYRLLTLDRDPLTRTPTVEIAHEALIREWERLREWLANAREDIRIQRRLGTAAAEWQGSKDASYLVSGVRLAQFETWAAETSLTITPPERAFLETSIVQREKEVQAEMQRQKRERSLEKRAQRFLRGLVIILALALLGTIALTGVAFTERANSEANLLAVRELALINGAQAAFADDDLDSARTLSLAAVTLTDHPSAASQLVLAESAYAPGTVRLYSDDRHNQPWSTAALSTDRHFLVTVPYNDVEANLVVWDLATSKVSRVFPTAHSDVVLDVAFRPTGEGEPRQLLTTSADGTMILWDFERAQPLRTFQGHQAGIWSAHFSADGRQIIAASDDNTLILWDTDSGEIVRTFAGHTGSVGSVQFSPEGSTLLSASDDGTVGLWEVASGRTIDQFEVGLQQISVIFSPEGTKFLVASGFDRKMSLWDIASHREIRSYRRRGPIGNQYFGHDGQTITAAEGDSITTWNLQTGEVVRVLAGHTHGITGIFPNADESQLLSVGVDGTLRLWDLGDGAEIMRTPSLRSVALMDDGDISPDGQTFVIAAGGNTLSVGDPGLVILYDATTGTEIRRFGVDGIAHSGNTGSVRFSPDGQTILSADWNGEIRLWNVTNSSLIHDYQGVTLAVNSVDFTPDGSAFIAATDDRSVVLENVMTG
ncbi:MAG: hypothetical protein ABI700_19150, partial [Chloroflexota bacterium]